MRLVVSLSMCVAMTFAVSDGQTQDKNATVPDFLRVWVYPKAKFEPTAGPYYRAVMTTPDSSKQVLDHYTTKVVLPVVGRPIPLPGGRLSVQTDEMLTEIRDLSRGIDEDRPASSVWVHTVIQDHPEYCAHVVITRAKDEKQTQVCLSYIRKKATANEVKDAAKDELIQLQGVWKCVDRQYTTAEGKKGASLEGVHFLTVTDNKFKVEIKAQPTITGIIPGWGDGTGTLSLEASRSPKHIDIKGLGNRKGIYKLDENRFTILLEFFVGRKGRPESFEDTKGTVLLIFEKVPGKE